MRVERSPSFLGAKRKLPTRFARQLNPYVIIKQMPSGMILFLQVLLLPLLPPLLPLLPLLLVTLPLSMLFLPRHLRHARAGGPYANTTTRTSPALPDPALSTTNTSNIRGNNASTITFPALSSTIHQQQRQRQRLQHQQDPPSPPPFTNSTNTTTATITTTTATTTAITTTATTSAWKPGCTKMCGDCPDQCHLEGLSK